MNLIIRQIQKEIADLHKKSRGRLLVITGARQTGKSTLAGMTFPEYKIINLDSPIEREIHAQMTPADWFSRYPAAVLDEIQKAPSLFDSIKATYDQHDDVRYTLLGSSQFLLMKNVKESLAGRAAIRELFPLSMPELVTITSGKSPAASRLIRLLESSVPSNIMNDIFPPDITLLPESAEASKMWDYFLTWGGMPVLTHSDFNNEDRFEWLQDYHATYLQRDLSDLARLEHLEPFMRAQKTAALRTGQRINFSDVARTSGISAPTARQFMNYLEISYQVILLPAWFANHEKRLTKQPKLHFIDPGVRRAILRKRGMCEGPEYESAIGAEIYKQIKNLRLPVNLHHLRTTDGREIDLLIEREDGYIALECKMSERAAHSDFRHMRDIDTILDKPLLLGLCVSNDRNVKCWNQNEKRNLWSVPVYSLLTGL